MSDNKLSKFQQAREKENRSIMDNTRLMLYDSWKKQMLPVAQAQYKADPKKFTSYDMSKNADYFMQNPLVKAQLVIAHLGKEDVVVFLNELKQFVIDQNSLDPQFKTVEEQDKHYLEIEANLNDSPIYKK